MQTFENTPIVVLGLGISGLAMARWCAKRQAQVIVADTRPEPPGLHALMAELPQVEFVHVSQWSAELLAQTQARALCRSPGLSPAQLAALTQAAQQAAVPVWSELDLFRMALQDLQATQNYAPRILAVTGTNGKTTVTSLTGALVERAGQSVCVAGNIGPSLLDALSRCIDSAALPQVWVLELSSFQLHDAQGFTPTMGTVLNLTQDHLDWHGDMAAYGVDKARIFGPHSADAPPMLLNRDDPQVMALQATAATAKKSRAYVSFGSDLPKRPGDWGLESVNGMTWLVQAQEADETIKRRKDEALEIHIQRLMPEQALRIRGRHNALNALAALALASAAGCALAPMLYGLREYRGLAHRVQSVAVVNDVEYFDDSKGTNVGATVAALQGLGAQSKIVVIMGGDGKGQDFSPLAAAVRQYARAVILIGRDGPAIERALASCGTPLAHASTMEQAVDMAAQQAQSGDAVMLSPACASFDMFKDYVHRAQVFVTAVQQLALHSGSLTSDAS